jgi:uridine kinase
MPAGLDGHPDPVVSAERSAVLRRLAGMVRAEGRPPRVLVGIDGASGTGKSTLADELGGLLDATGVSVIRSSIDSFHRPRAERYRRGAASAEGYYRDSHDPEAVRRCLLDPFRSGSESVQTAAFDEPTDQPSIVWCDDLPRDAVLVFDGLFLLRPELADCWDVSVFLLAGQRREAAWQEYLRRDLPTDPEERAAETAARVARARRGRYTDGQAL